MAPAPTWPPAIWGTYKGLSLLSEHTVQLGSHEETRASWNCTLPRHSPRKPGFRAMMVGKVDTQGPCWPSKVFSQVFAT